MPTFTAEELEARYGARWEAVLKALTTAYGNADSSENLATYGAGIQAAYELKGQVANGLQNLQGQIRHFQGAAQELRRIRG